MSDQLRKVLRIAGIVLIGAALCAIGYAGYNLIVTDIDTNQSLNDVNNMLAGADQAVQGIQDDPASPAGQTDPAEPTMDNEPADPWIEDVPEDSAPPQSAGAEASAKPKSNTKPKISYMGKLVLVSLGNRQVPVINGASSANLSRGAVHHTRSSPAGGEGNCVIYGHRSTVFRGFAKLKIGDEVRLEVPGNTYVYHITSMTVVQPDDPAIFKAYSGRVMTLVTCYPHNYLGPAPQRYIVVCTMD